MSPRDRAPRADRAARPLRQAQGPDRWSRRAASPLDGGFDGFLDGPALKSVLVVDGDDFGREALGQLLEADGYRVRRAADRSQAATLLVEQTPDLIVADLMTPGLGGWGAIRRLRREPGWRQVPVIVVSALDAPATYGRVAGIAACFEKPVSAEALRAAVRRQLG